jgi:hypothetical protein
MTQHAGLSVERWGRFTRDQQLLMIANEMNRAQSLMRPEDRTSLGYCYERALQLTDLTIEVQPARSLRRELLRWRELLGGLYVAPEPRPHEHAEVFRALLLLVPATYAQIPYVLER